MKRLYKNLLLLAITVSIISCEQESTKVKSGEITTNEGLLQHNVYFYLQENISLDEKTDFERGLQKLLSISTIRKSEVGIPGATKKREVTDHEFDYSLFIWFDSMKDYEIYAEHPDHLKFIEKFKHLWIDVKVYDSQIVGISPAQK